MKAVPVLLCLALAHGITASIFKHEDPQVDNLEVQRLEYIDQYQRQHRNLPSETARRYQHRMHHREEERDQPRTQPEDQERDQQRQQQGSYQRDEKRYQQPAQQREQRRRQSDQVDRETQYQKQQWEQHRQYSQDFQPEHYQFNEPTLEQSQEQYAPKTHVKRSHHKKTYQQSESASSESSQTSQESRERRQYYDNKKSRTENQKWESLQDTVKSQETQNFVDNEEIQRDVLKMVIGPNASVQEKEEIEKIFSDAQNAMKHISQEDKVRFHQIYESAKQQDNEDAELNATQLAQKHQYPVEEHMIKTDDGYELTLFRIPPKMQIRDVQKKPVVFLMHGIDGSADDWLLMGPRKSLAYLLSDAGYDVWLGNARGNKYSRNHVSKHPAVPDFWQYSNDEIALHDLPAMIDYALKTTKQEKLYYIGHSQGTTAFFALTATRPEYNDKIIMMYALSPVVYMTNVRSPLFRMMAPTSKFSNRLQQQLGNGPFTPSKDLIKTVGGAMLEKEIGCKKVSSHPSFVMAGVDVDNLDFNLIPVVMRHLPAGTSTKVIKQFAQAVSSQEFRKFDHGSKINQKVYGKEQPPKYEMEKVQAPVTLFYSEEDWLAHPKDVERLVKELPNVKETHKVADEHFSHMDFQFSKKAPEMVYRRLIESMQNNQ